MSEDDQVAKEQLRARLEMLEAMIVAAQRRADVFGIVDNSDDPTDARHKLADLLALSDAGAGAVLSMPVGRLARSEQDKIQAERDRIRARLW
jgi:DNA gyrase/topoisomerase IV subunit A